MSRFWFLFILGVCSPSVSASFFTHYVFLFVPIIVLFVFLQFCLPHFFSFLCFSFVMLVVFWYFPLAYPLLSYNSSALLIFICQHCLVEFSLFFTIIHSFLRFSFNFFILFMKLSFCCVSVFPLLPSSSLARPRNNFHIAMGPMGAIDTNESQRSGLTQQQQIQNIDPGNRKNCDIDQWPTSHESPRSGPRSSGPSWPFLPFCVSSNFLPLFWFFTHLFFWKWVWARCLIWVVCFLENFMCGWTRKMNKFLFMFMLLFQPFSILFSFFILHRFLLFFRLFFIQTQCLKNGGFYEII